MIYAILFFGIILLDQITKAVVEANKVHVTVIEDIFSISITRNEGAAFSMLHNQDWAQTFFIIITVLILIGFCIYLIFTKKQSKFFMVSSIMVMGGAVGNFIDRVALKSVRDFIDVHFFANFNVADVFICVGAFLLALYFLFIDEDAIFAKRKQ